MTASSEPLSRPDWRDSLNTATDLALVSVVVVLACLPVVTAGAALASATVAVDHVCRQRCLPPTRDLARTFVRTLPGGFAALLVASCATALIYLDVRLLASGAIPGGPVAVAAIACVGAVSVALAGVCLVRVGQTGGTGWRSALAWSARLLGRRPFTVPAVLATAAVPVALALAVPVLSFVLPGFALFGLHVVVRRAT
jgi:hypothetical protein